MADSPYFDSAYFDGSYFDVDAPTEGGHPARKRIRRVKPVEEVIDEDWIVLLT